MSNPHPTDPLIRYCRSCATRRATYRAAEGDAAAGALCCAVCSFVIVPPVFPAPPTDAREQAITTLTAERDAERQRWMDARAGELEQSIRADRAEAQLTALRTEYAHLREAAQASADDLLIAAGLLGIAGTDPAAWIGTAQDRLTALLRPSSPTPEDHP